MRLGLGLGLTAPRRPSATWVPTTLNGTLLWLDHSLASSLSTDSAGSTPVAADGDPIGRIVDQGPNARVFTASGTRRPLYRSTDMAGGRACGKYDKIDDGLTGTANWCTTGACTLAFDFELTAAISSFQTALYLGDGTYSTTLYFCSSGTYQTITWRCSYSANANGVGYGGLSGAWANTNRHRIVIGYNGSDNSTPGNYSLLLDGVSQTVTTSGAFNVTAAGVSLGAYPAGALPAPIKLRRVAIWSQDHTASAAAIDAWLNA